jgi:hypothetical protein
MVLSSCVPTALEVPQCPWREEGGELTLAGAGRSTEPHVRDGAFLELERFGAGVAPQAQSEHPPEVGLMTYDGNTVGLRTTAPQHLEHLFR